MVHQTIESVWEEINPVPATWNQEGDYDDRSPLMQATEKTGHILRELMDFGSVTAANLRLSIVARRVFFV